MAAPSRNAAFEFAGVAWRLAVYVAVLIATFRLLSMGYGWAIQVLGVHFARAPGARPAEAVALGQARLLIAAIIAWTVTARLGRDRLGPILHFGPNSASDLLQGILWGFAGIGATIGGVVLFGGYRVSGIALSGGSLLYYLPLWLVVALLTGLAENLAFLGYPLFRVARTTGWTPAILVGGILFAAAHLGNPGESPLGIASVFLMAALMALAIKLTGDLWLSAGIHAGLIIAEDLVFSVPDSGVVYTGHLLTSRVSGPIWLSGGDGGPEASVLALPIFAILLIVIWPVYRRRLGPASPVEATS
jgi:membrane protease YdiL (CAAX protease family)